jgi:N-acetylglucosamine kinase-like BadF-type ATPase
MTKKQLTHDQIARLEIAVNEMARRGNPFAQAIAKALEGKTTTSEKRNTLSGSYARMFEAMTVMGMAINSKFTPEKFEERLQGAEQVHGN